MARSAHDQQPLAERLLPVATGTATQRQGLAKDGKPLRHCRCCGCFRRWSHRRGDDDPSFTLPSARRRCCGTARRIKLSNLFDAFLLLALLGAFYWAMAAAKCGKTALAPRPLEGLGAQMPDASTSASLEAISHVDVVVVGAGYAGLSAARDLKAAGLNVLVLEAAENVGGRARSHSLLGGTTAQLGGDFVADRSLQPHAWQLIVDELNFTARRRADSPGGDSVLNMEPNTGIRYPTSLRLHKVGWRDVSSVLRLVTKVPNAVGAYTAFATWDAYHAALPANAEAYDNVTVESWMCEHLDFPETRALLRNVVLSVFGEEPAAVSLLSAVQGLGGGRWRSHLFGLWGMQDYRVVQGAHAPLEKIAEDLDTGALRLSTPVVAISQDTASVKVDVKPASPLRPWAARAQRVLVTSSPATFARIAFSPQLPAKRQSLLRNLAMGSVVKVLVAYETPFWRAEGLSGQVISTAGPDETQVLFHMCADSSPFGATIGVLFCLCAGECSALLMQRPEAERKDIATKHLARTFGDKALSPLEYVDFDWRRDPYTGGAYSVVHPPGALTLEDSGALAEDFGLLHWAGADVLPPDSRNFGSIDGAIESGRAAARRLIAELPAPSALALGK
eukprot:CAMPEP_0117491862 /NCGR_PEP_ID=MMETSP0784-20121206/18284_1 /TAXON_ID=39447 /ORGANISM="" /LENGTH=618 /DNA_ID=CAMNT_0005286663 /DNA_START=59 /DNA_END=1915 /DNA_ORIENTATION=+